MFSRCITQVYSMNTGAPSLRLFFFSFYASVYLLDANIYHYFHSTSNNLKVYKQPVVTRFAKSSAGLYLSYFITCIYKESIFFCNNTLSYVNMREYTILQTSVEWPCILCTVVNFVPNPNYHTPICTSGR